MAKNITKQVMQSDGTRIISAERGFSWKRLLFQWEWMLVLMLIIVNIFNISVSPNYANVKNILNATRDFLDKAIVVFPMAFVLMLGEIDISVASIMALSATIMGIVYQACGNMALAICAALGVGTVCGLINGVILVKFPELSSMILTLSTQIIYRGIARIILETNSVSGFPSWFTQVAAGKIGGMAPYVLVFTILEAKIIVFTMEGLFSAIAAVYLASKMSSVRPDVAKGYELDIIAMAVLGGVSTSGGKGRIPGAALSILVIGYLRYGLRLINASSQIIMIVVGALLIIAVAIPSFRDSIGNANWFKKLKAMAVKP